VVAYTCVKIVVAMCQIQAAMASWDALPEEQRQARIMQLKLAASMRNRQVVSE